MIFNMDFYTIPKYSIINLFKDYPKDSFEYNYIFNDCIPYFDTHNYWSKNLPIGVYEDVEDTNDMEIVGVCFFILDDYKGLKYLDIKRIMTCTKFRGEGYGSKLYQAICNHALYSDVKYIRMFCAPEAKDFYKYMGCKFHGECENGYSFVFQPIREFTRNADTLILEKEFIDSQIKKYNGKKY
jgi:GNAT superfamily N-acetyltransferase